MKKCRKNEFRNIEKKNEHKFGIKKRISVKKKSPKIKFTFGEKKRNEK